MGNMRDQKIPSARNSGLVVQKLENEVLVYDTERQKAHCLNQNAALIWEHCDGHRTVSDLSDLLRAKTSDTVIGKKEGEELVWTALDQLEKSHLLQEPIARPENVNRLSRRELMKAAGIAALVAVPVVSTVLAPTAAQASTCQASGQSCSISATCCSGLCSSGACA